MSRYEGLTATLLTRKEQRVTLTFAELDGIVGGLPNSAKTYGAWWANNRNSQPHARYWLDAGRRASPDFRAECAVFELDESVLASPVDAGAEPDPQQALADFVEGSITLERDLEDHLVRNLGQLEEGLTFVSRQATLDVGRVDILAKSHSGETVIIEVKAGEARDAAIGQVARYIGWFRQAEGKMPRAILIAGSFPEPVIYAAAAIPALKLVTYRVSFTFAEAARG
ncbi:MAG: Endonuclease NucS [Xanthomonadales bacterium]|nr:Endonuclease NucS [Xanthomonadales bacterium]